MVDGDLDLVLSPVLPGFPGSSDGKASAYNVGDLGLIPGLEGSPREGNGNLLQYSCLENPMDWSMSKSMKKKDIGEVDKKVLSTFCMTLIKSLPQEIYYCQESLPPGPEG